MFTDFVNLILIGGAATLAFVILVDFILDWMIPTSEEEFDEDNQDE